MARHPELDIDLHTLDRTSRVDLRALWNRVLGEAPPRCLGRDVLALGIAYAIQERREGGLTRRVAKELDRLLAGVLDGGRKGAGRRPSATPLPRTGTVLIRQWQGSTHHVTVVAEGFLWNGRDPQKPVRDRAVHHGSEVERAALLRHA